MKLTWKIGVVLSLLSLFSISLVSLLMFDNSRQTIDNSTHHHLESVNLLKEREFVNWIEANQQAIRRIATRPLVNDLVAQMNQIDHTSPEYQMIVDDLYTNHLTQLVEDTLGFTEMFILDYETGEILVSSDQTNIGKLRFSQPYFQIGREKTTVENAYYLVSEAEQFITVATPLLGFTNQPVGVLAGHLNFDNANSIMGAALEDSKTTDTILVNAFNFPITQGRFADDNSQTRAMHSPALDNCLSGQDGTLHYTNHQSIEVIGAYDWLDSLDACILTEIRESEAFEPILALRDSAIISAVAVTTLSIVIGIGLARSILRPIQTLVASVERVGRGDLDHQVNIRSGDEIGDLSRSFDQMITNLRRITASRDELDAEILVRQEVESQLREREQTLSVALSAAQAGVWQWDIRSNQVIWDEASEVMFGLAPGTFDGTYDSWKAHVHPEDLAMAESHVQDTLTHQTNLNVRFRIVQPSGDIRHISSQALLIVDDNGQPTEMIGIHVDITEILVAQENLRQSQELLQSVVNSESMLVLRTDMDGKYTFVNEAMHSRYRWMYETIDDMLGTDSMLTILEEDHAKVFDAVKTCIENVGMTVSVECRKPDAIGGYFWSLWEFVAIRNDQGNVTAIQCVGVDITERRNTEEALHQMSYELIERVKELRGIQDIGRLADDNLNLPHYFEKVIERIPASMQYPDLCQVLIEFDDAVYGSRLSSDLPYLISKAITVNGQYRGQLITGYDDERLFINDEYQHVQSIADRIGQYVARWELFQQLQQALELSEKSNRELELFAYVASHDLQEPLRMVTSYLGLLEKRYKGQLDENADQFIYYAVDGASRMKVLINDLLQYSRINTRGKEFEPTDLNDVMQLVLRDLHLMIEECQVTINVEPLPIINADDTQMKRLFQNLIANAIKFHGDTLPEINITCTSKDNMWEIIVQDNGIGIDPAYQEKIFVIFQRLHSRQEYEGTGIGLAVCKRIVERHHGTIYVESELGEGARFIIQLPQVSEVKR